MADCVVCENKHVGRNVVTVPDLKRRVMVRAHFCSKHVLPDHILRIISDAADLKRCIREHLGNARKKGHAAHRSLY